MARLGATAVCVALLGAFGELALLAVNHFVHGERLGVGSQVVWMTPAADVLFFLLLALLLAPLLRRLPQATALRTAVTVFVFLGVLGICLVDRWRYPIAYWILAAGAGVQAGRLAADAPARWHAMVRRALPVLVGLALALAAGYAARGSWRERRALAALPAASGAAPNVLLLIWDTVRARSLDLYGYVRPTSPQLDRLAQQGVTFDMAVSSAPWTLPAHAGMFTGHLPGDLGVGWQRGLDGRFPTLAEVLAAHGYETAGFVANTIYTSYEFGLDRGFLHYEDYRVTPGTFVVASSLLRALSNMEGVRRLVGFYDIPGRKSASEVNRQFLRWLDGRDRAHPFFVFLNTFDAHAPYRPPTPFDTLFGPPPREPLHPMRYRTNGADYERLWALPPERVKAQQDAYDGAIAYLDAQLGTLLGALRARGLLDNTLVIVAADHGEEFGRHGVFRHGNSLYLPSVRVPLVIAWPGRIPADTRVAEAVSLADLARTVTEAAGIAAPPLPGRSLARFWIPGAAEARGTIALSRLSRGEVSAPAWYPARAGALTSVVADGFHLIRRGDGSLELYDLASDREERHNLAHVPDYTGEVSLLERFLDLTGAAPSRGEN